MLLTNFFSNLLCISFDQDSNRAPLDTTDIQQRLYVNVRAYMAQQATHEGSSQIKGSITPGRLVCGVLI